MNGRFDYSNPPHPANSALIDWHVYDMGERISVSTLVVRANQLQQQLDAIEQSRGDQNCQCTINDSLADTEKYKKLSVFSEKTRSASIQFVTPL